LDGFDGKFFSKNDSKLGFSLKTWMVLKTWMEEKFQKTICYRGGRQCKIFFKEDEDDT
jgi:hypothetical protein